MRRWRFATSGHFFFTEGALWLAVLVLSLEEASGRTSSLGTVDKNVPRSRRTWCEETRACAGCEGRKRPRCSGQEEPLLGADLCECCFSCVVDRGLGESCGSQLSTQSHLLETTILATTWCREGLACVNFACADLDTNIGSARSSRLRTDEEFVGFEQDQDETGVFQQGSKFEQETGASFLEPVPVDHDSIKTDSSYPIVETPASALMFRESRKKTRPCYAEPEKTMIISSFPSDDSLGRLATAFLDDRRFHIVYSGDLLLELRVLLNVVEAFDEDSFPDEETADSLVDAFLDSLSTIDEDGVVLGDQDYAEVLTPLIFDSNKTQTSLSSSGSVFPATKVLKRKRELETKEEDLVGFEAPGSIQEILIRGASAHREYVHEDRAQDSGTLDESPSPISAKGSSQEVESTVRVHITNRPRKIQTLVDLEEDEEEEEIGDKGRQNLKSSNRENSKGAGKLSPVTEEQSTASPGTPRFLGPTETAKLTPQVLTTPWNDTLMTLNDRLTLVEVRVNVFERVLEEMAKWCNLGVLPIARDCLLPQNSDVQLARWGPDPEEYFALASGIDTVGFRGNGRKFNELMPRKDEFYDRRIPDLTKIGNRGRNSPRNRNSFRTIIGNGSPRRPASSGSRRLGKSSCRNPDRHRSSWRQPIPEDIVDSPVHRIALRSVPSTNSVSRNSSRLENETNADRDYLGDIFPRLERASVSETASKDLNIFILNEKKRDDEEDRLAFPRLNLLLGKFGEPKSGERAKRSSIKNADGTLQKISEKSSGITKLFERETARKKELEVGVNRDGCSEASGMASPLIVTGIREFSKVPEPIVNRLLFRSHEYPKIPGSTATTTSETQKLVYLDTTTGYGNSTIRIEDENGLRKIGNTPISKEDFDHIYEIVEAEDEDGDFEYDVAYDQVDYVDGSRVEIVTEVGVQEPEIQLKSELDVLRDEIHTMIFPRERNRRVARIEDDQCESPRSRKRELPLVLFGSPEKQEPKTIVWPSKWIGYRRDRLQGQENRGMNMNTGFSTTMKPSDRRVSL